METSVALQQRLLSLHRQAKDTSTLPFQIHELTGTLLATALNWNNWYDADDVLRLGMKNLISLVDREHYDDTPLEFGEVDLTMPFGDTTPVGFDWRTAKTRWDDAPMDVVWTRGQIEDL